MILDKVRNISVDMKHYILTIDSRFVMCNGLRDEPLPVVTFRMVSPQTDSIHEKSMACHGPTLVGRAIIVLYDGPRPGPSNQVLVGRGPAWPVNCSDDGPRPSPADHIFNKPQPGPARPITCQRGQ